MEEYEFLNRKIFRYHEYYILYLYLTSFNSYKKKSVHKEYTHARARRIETLSVLFRRVKRDSCMRGILKM